LIHKPVPAAGAHTRVKASVGVVVVTVVALLTKRFIDDAIATKRAGNGDTVPSADLTLRFIVGAPFGDSVAVIAVLLSYLIGITVATFREATIECIAYLRIIRPIITCFITLVTRWNILTSKTVTAAGDHTIRKAGTGITVGIAIITRFVTIDAFNNIHPEQPISTDR